MAKFWEIAGWDEGVKLRRKVWIEGFCTSKNDAGMKLSWEAIHADDWEVYKEPKKKIKVILWNPIMKSSGRYSSSVQWTSDKSVWDRDKDIIVAWESREVEVDD